MHVVFYVDVGCLGPNGQNLVDLFCRHLNGYIRRALGDIGVGIETLPRTDIPEIRYFDSISAQQELDDEQIDTALTPTLLGRDEFEDGLVDLVIQYAESEEWQSVVNEF